MELGDSHRFYSQRLSGSSCPEIGLVTWGAFRTLIYRLAEDNYFCEDFPSECYDGIPIHMDDSLVARALREELGTVSWPIPEDQPPTTTQILDLMELFFGHVSKPIKSWFHDYCGGSHPEEYDRRQGRYKYTIEVNNILTRFNHPYELRRGQIKRTGSEIQDEYIWSLELPTDDTHLQDLLSRAINLYYDRSGKHKMDGLCCLVDAFERLKSLLDPANKKSSVGELVARLAPDSSVSEHYDSILAALTDIGNTHAIRHHEVGKVQLTDDALLDFLFHTYFAVVRFALQRTHNSDGTEH